MSEVHTAVRIGLGGQVFMVFDNGVYGTIKNHRDRKFPGVRVIINSDFADACKEAITASVPTVIQAMTSPDQIDAWAD